MTTGDAYYDKVLALVTRLDLQGDITDPDLAAKVAADLPRPDGYVTPDADVRMAAAPGPNGDVPVRVYSPLGGALGAPLLVWCHGGGWIGGDLDMAEADLVARELVSRVGAVVVSVDYRLAVNGAHYPTPNDDVVAAFAWAVASSAELGADPARIAFGGASAGANLVAGAVLRLRDEGGELPRAVLLVYPLVHAVLPELHDELAAKVAPLTPFLAFAPEVLTPVVENYLGGEVDSATPYAMASLGDLAGYPPTLVVNCEHDALRASGEAFTALLEAAGVTVEQVCAPGALHGHLNHPWLPAAQDSLDSMASWLAGKRP